MLPGDREKCRILEAAYFKLPIQTSKSRLVIKPARIVESFLYSHPSWEFCISSVVFDYKDRDMRMNMGNYGMREPDSESELQNRTLACVHTLRLTCGFGK